MNDSDIAAAAPHEDRLGAAYHEAGHAVVASALGLTVARIEIAIGGDDAKGEANTEGASKLPLIDRIAILAAGIESQRLFKAPTHELSGHGDYGMMIGLLDGFDESASLALIDEGHKRAYVLLQLHADKVKRIVSALMAHRKLERRAIMQLLP
jgi:ATP-dependent Zn protease